MWFSYKMVKYLIYFYLFLINVTNTKGSRDVKSSLTFVIDSSGSMRRVVKQVREEVDSIFDIVMNSNTSQIEDFVLVKFADTAEVVTVTRDRETFRSELLKGPTPNSGGDCPEVALTGIELALTNSREASSLYIFTDASAKDHEKFTEVAALSQRKRSQLVFVLTDDCGSRDKDEYKVYHKLAKATQGQVFRLNDNDFDKILHYIKNSIKSRPNIITSKIYPAGNYKFDLNVDSDTKELLIAMTGQDPAVDVTDADGMSVPIENITRTVEIAVVKVSGMKPGSYQVEVGSDTETNVLVSGTTTVHFQHGFSAFEPTTLDDTATRPIPGEQAYLSIKLACEGKVELQSIQLLDMNDSVVLDKPVRLIDEDEKFYITDPIFPPSHMFRIAIKGYDTESNTYLTRLSLTPIQPQYSSVFDIPERAPTVSKNEEDKIKAEFNKPFSLKCIVSGYPKPDITWESDDEAVLSHNVTVVEIAYYYRSILRIKNATNLNTYTCKAKNKLGMDLKRVTVLVERKHFFNVLNVPNDTEIEYTRRGQVLCQVDAFPPASVSWWRGRRPLVSDASLQLAADNSSLTVRSMEPRLAGNYMCEIRNGEKRRVVPFTISVKGAEKPKINKNFNEYVQLEHSSVDIRCDTIRGKPKPTFTWYYRKGYFPNEKYTKLDETGDTIRIDSVRVEDSGTYQCKAKNFMGSDKLDIEFIVEYPPFQTESTSARVTAAAGGAVTLRCPADGAPPPAYTWRRGGAALPGYHTGTLKFTATLDNSGLYECEVKNDHGYILVQTYVNVNVPVDIETPKKTKRTVMVGEELNLPCRVRGVPEPTVSWIFSSKESGLPYFTAGDSSGTFHIKRTQLKHAGFYTCVAANDASSKNITYTVEVAAPPSITYTKKAFTAVIEDYLIQIPCNASGNPKPDIIWKKDLLDIPSGRWYDFWDDGTLIIKDIDIKAAGRYQCTASNRYGSVHETFEAIVKSYPDPGLIDQIWLEKSRPATVSCNVPHQNSDRIRWFKDGHIESRGELSIKNVTPHHYGLYTCRVSSVTGEVQTRSVEINVGSKPDFLFLNEDTNKQFVVGNFALLSCDTSGEPKPKIQWYHDDVPVYVTSFTYEVEMVSQKDKGRYKCIVSNMFGKVEREYVVLPQECKLDLQKDFGGNDPLILTKLRIVGGYLHMAAGETIEIYCPSTFMEIPRRHIRVECVNEKKFIFDRKHFSYSNLKCDNKIRPVVQPAHHRCTNYKSSEMMIIGFEAPSGFFEVYKSCVDTYTRHTIYTQQTITLFQANVIPEYHIDWTDSDNILIDIDELYDCSSQNQRISSILRKDFHGTDGCCFARRQLVSPRDVAPGLPQTATYASLNLAAQWSTCNSQNWEEVEDLVRSLVKILRRDLQVWTGTAGALQLPDDYSSYYDVVISDTYSEEYQIPTYFWKVVQDPLENASLAIVQMNVPDLQMRDIGDYRVCRDICSDVDWMRDLKTRRVPRRGYTYCCELKEFERSFNLQGVFPIRDGILRNVL